MLEALQTFELPLKPLKHFEGNITNDEQTGILFSLKDYLELVGYTGRCVSEDKRGAIPSHIPAILSRLNIERGTWQDNATQFEKIYRKAFSKRQNRYRSSA